MKVTQLRAFQVDLPLHEGCYECSGGKTMEVWDSMVVAVDTDAGITGYGEVRLDVLGEPVLRVG